MFHCCFLFLVLNLLSCRLNGNRIRGSYGPNPGSQDGSDSTPNPFEFTDQNDVALSSLTLSNIVQISGIDKKVDISISGDGNPEFRICLDVICTQEVQTWSSSPSFKKVENQYYLQIRQISSASYNTLALATLKLGTISASWQIQTLLAPVSPPVFSGWKQIQVGFSSCGIALNGKAYCWGLDNHGQLGENADGDNLLENTPTAVDTTALIPGTHFVSLTLGVWHTCGLTSNGQAYCWGWDVSGQLGENADGDNLDENIPVAVDTTNLTPGSSFVSLSAGDSHTCGLASDGKAYCWGLDNFGQLGENADGDNLNEIIPVAVDTSALTPGSSFVEISAGAGHTCGLSSDGKAFCWGLDDHGQLGENADGDNLPENIPVLVDTSALTAGSNFVAIKLGLSHSCGLASDGKAFCWGRDNNGQLGENADGDNLDENIPVAIDISNLDPGSNFISLQTGAYHTCGLTDNHKAYCWGSDGDGQLGENADGDNLDENIPVAVDTSPLAAGTQFVSLSLSEASSHSCGIASDSKAYCWGWDAFGQLGEDADGDNLSENIPVLVDTTGLISAHTFIQIVTGAGHSCGISSSGTAYCWGWDSDGQLGEDADGDDLDENLPVEVNTSALTPGSTFISLWAGNFHTCGLASDGLAYCWGQDVYGQLGESIYNDNLDKGIPVAVDTSALTPGTRFVSLSTGSNHTCGLASNGRA
ncbi:MAG: hypothetical protein KDD35_05500, partial [Bdellovibrionales bacterium]|nr:hypothetical protein [Bdellovibrionales bacterium]